MEDWMRDDVSRRAFVGLDGHKVAGPQPTGLPVYPAARDGDVVWVDVSS